MTWNDADNGVMLFSGGGLIRYDTILYDMI